MSKHTLIAMAMAACLGAVGTHAHDPPTHERELVEILEGLERGIEALERLERWEEIDVMRRVADDLRGELRARGREGEPRRGDRERELVGRQIETLRLALPALREARRADAVHLVSLAIAAREHLLAGHRDHDRRGQAPAAGQIVELLKLAASLDRERGREGRAARLQRLAGELWQPRGGGPAGRAALEEIEIMRMAIHGLMEADRRDAAELLERALHARQVTREGRRDREARHIRDNAPELGAQVELLQVAAGIWREYGDLERAEAINELAERIWARRRDALPEDPRRAWRRGSEPDDAVLDRLERLERRLDELQRALDEAREQMRWPGR